MATPLDFLNNLPNMIGDSTKGLANLLSGLKVPGEETGEEAAPAQNFTLPDFSGLTTSLNIGDDLESDPLIMQTTFFLQEWKAQKDGVVYDPAEALPDADGRIALLQEFATDFNAAHTGTDYPQDQLFDLTAQPGLIDTKFVSAVQTFAPAQTAAPATQTTQADAATETLAPTTPVQTEVQTEAVAEAETTPAAEPEPTVPGHIPNGVAAPAGTDKWVHNGLLGLGVISEGMPQSEADARIAAYISSTGITPDQLAVQVDKDVRQWQALLKDDTLPLPEGMEGPLQQKTIYDIGTFGENKDGIDGKFGDFTTKGSTQFLTDYSLNSAVDFLHPEFASALMPAEPVASVSESQAAPETPAEIVAAYGSVPDYALTPQAPVSTMLRIDTALTDRPDLKPTDALRLRIAEMGLGSPDEWTYDLSKTPAAIAQQKALIESGFAPATFENLSAFLESGSTPDVATTTTATPTLEERNAALLADPRVPADIKRYLTPQSADTQVATYDGIPPQIETQAESTHKFTINVPQIDLSEQVAGAAKAVESIGSFLTSLKPNLTQTPNDEALVPTSVQTTLEDDVKQRGPNPAI